MTQPGIIITGATGFLGNRLVKYLHRKYRIFALGRRTPEKARTFQSPNVHWFQVDIGHFDPLREVFSQIREMGGAELLLHLAGYYDFTGEDHPEYTHTNVIGTRNVLELSVPLELKRFFFTSSVAACPFPEAGQTITEETPPTAPPPYSQSKRKGEEMMYEYQDRIPTCIVRLAAIFSNWCEYEPLNNFLETWFANSWNSRILGGKGQWAIPYLHVRDLLAFYLRVIERCCDPNESLMVLQASPDGATTHLELYQEATRNFYGSVRSPIYVPKPMAQLGINMRQGLGRVTGKMPFERSWMGNYIDQQLNIDASLTRQRLDWEPHQKLNILDCIPAMVHNMGSDPEEWQIRFELAKKGMPKTDLFNS